MRARKLLQLWSVMPLVVVATAATAQIPLCSTVPFSEREAFRSIGACRDVAPIVDIVPRSVESAPSVIVAVPNVIGLGFDDARDRLAGFSLRRSYRASAQPGGTVLEQQPAPATRLAAGAIVRLVLSDATLRPAPRVSPAEIDGLPAAAARTEVRPQSAITSDTPRAGQVIEQSPTGAAEQSSTSTPLPRTSESPGVSRFVVPNVGGMTFRDAQARLGNFRVQRRERASSAPIGRVVEQIPRASARAPLASVVTLVVSSGPARATPVIETFELPNVVGRSYADASAALSEFKVARIEKASEAPSGQVLGQEPAPGTSLTPGSAVGLQVSDGSLAKGAITAPVDAAIPAVTTPVEPTAPAATAPTVDTAASDAVATPAESTPPTPAPTPAAAPPATASSSAPAQSDRLPVTFPSSATLLLIAGVLFGVGLGALLTRRWFLRRQPVERFEPDASTLGASAESEQVAVPAAVPPAAPLAALPAVPTTVPVVSVPVAEAAPVISFAARLDEGQTTIEFAPPSDADEMTMEHSRELHE